MSRLSTLVPLIRFEERKCSLPVTATRPLELTSVEKLLDGLCFDGNHCDGCPFYRLKGIEGKLTS